VPASIGPSAIERRAVRGGERAEAWPELSAA